MATFIEALKRIVGLAQLPVGWDYGRGGPADRTACVNAGAIVRMLNTIGIKGFDIVPGVNGAITVFGYKGNESVEIQAFADGSYDFLHEFVDADGEIVSDLTAVGISEKLEECGWQSPRLFVSCTQSVTSRENVDLLGLHSIIQPGVEYRLLNPSAPKKPRAIYARTFGSSTMRGSRENRQSSGEYRAVPSEIYA